MRRQVERIDPIRSKFGTLEKEEVDMDAALERGRRLYQGAENLPFYRPSYHAPFENVYDHCISGVSVEPIESRENFCCPRRKPLEKFWIKAKEEESEA